MRSSIVAITLGFVFLIPFALLEFVNRRQFDEGFPLALFGFAWILQSLFVTLLIPLIDAWRKNQHASSQPIMLVLRVAGMLLIAYIWMGWVADQWPCLIGVPNCD